MGWNGPEQLGGQLQSDIKVVSWDVNRLDAFAVGRWPDNTSLMHKWWDGRAWGGWESLGGSYSSYLDAVSCKPNRLDAFVLGPRADPASSTLSPVPLWHTWWTGQRWEGPEPLGGSLVTVHPTAVSWSEWRYYDVFAVGFDRTLQHWWSDARGAVGPDFGGPVSLGGNLDYVAPKAVSWGPDRCDVFALGRDGSMQHWWLTWQDPVRIGPDEYTGGTHQVHGPESLGAGPFFGEPAAVSWGPNRIDIFALDNRNTLQHKWWDGVRWNGWEALGEVSGPVTAVSWGANRIDLFAIGSVPGSPIRLWHRWWDGRAWGGPEFLGPWGISRPAAVCWGPNRIDVFGRETGSYMYHTWWDGITGGGTTPTTPPATDTNVRGRFEFILTRDDWQRFITPAADQIFVAVAPPGTDPTRATRYPLSAGVNGWTASVPASAGGPGVWKFRCHIRGVNAQGRDTGDLWSPFYEWDWQVGSPAAYFYFNSGGTGNFDAGSWNIRVLNS